MVERGGGRPPVDGHPRWRRCSLLVAVGLALLATSCSLVLGDGDGDGDGAAGGGSDRGGAGADGLGAGGQGRPPVAVDAPCPFDTTLVTEVECGRVTMPGRGADPEFTVEITFARFLATGAAADVEPDPVVFLHGGPGSDVLSEAVARYESIVAPFVEVRDVILYDQRGAGESSPLPPCSAVNRLAVESLEEPISHDEQVARISEALADCADRRFGPGRVDPTAFSTKVNVGDLTDLLRALDIDEYNLHGSSYGSHLAQAVMRDAPVGVRSVVLTGVYPTDVSPFTHIPITVETALDAIFDGCGADEQCRTALPDPWGSLEDLVAELDRDPDWVDDAPGRSGFTPATFDGDQFLDALHSLLYSREGAAMVPDLLIDVEDGDRNRLRRLADNALGVNRWVLTGLLVVCADEKPFPPTAADLAPATRSVLLDWDDAQGLLGLHTPTYCDALGVDWIVGDQNDPVTWPEPTLLLSGVADPITPEIWARQLAARLPRGRLVVNPVSTHDAAIGWCEADLLGDFIRRPDRLLDLSCFDPIASLGPNGKAMRYGEVAESSAVELAIEELDPFEVLLPDWVASWQDRAHVRWRNLDILDPTALVVVGPTSAIDVVDLVGLNQFVTGWRGAPSDLTPTGWERSTSGNGGIQLIRYRDPGADLALVVVVEAGDPDSIEAEVLVPAVESIEGSP